jgi:hypothetical protein
VDESVVQSRVGNQQVVAVMVVTGAGCRLAANGRIRQALRGIFHFNH